MKSVLFATMIALHFSIAVGIGFGLDECQGEEGGVWQALVVVTWPAWAPAAVAYHVISGSSPFHCVAEAGER